MKKQKFDEIEYTFTVVSEDFKEMVDRKFKISLVEIDGTLQFETLIPDYIYTEAGKIWPEFYDYDFIKQKREENTNGAWEWLTRKVITKVLRSAFLDGIKSELWDLSKKIEKYHTFEETIGEKVIFVRFRGSTTNERERTFGGDMGLENNIDFQYFTGYRQSTEMKPMLSDKTITIEKLTSYYKCGMSEQGENHKYKETQLVPLYNTQNEMQNLKGYYIILPWSQEREDYLKKIQDSFTTLTNKLNEFLKDLTEEKLDHLIENHPITKLLPE